MKPRGVPFYSTPKATSRGPTPSALANSHRRLKRRKERGENSECLRVKQLFWDPTLGKKGADVDQINATALQVQQQSQQRVKPKALIPPPTPLCVASIARVQGLARPRAERVVANGVTPRGGRRRGTRRRRKGGGGPQSGKEGSGAVVARPAKNLGISLARGREMGERRCVGPGSHESSNMFSSLGLGPRFGGLATYVRDLFYIKMGWWRTGTDSAQLGAASPEPGPEGMH
ncbi:hypothetical protein H6P81_001713 [Aristolochia fimbriata]|uniref:Uncharacterized protein n=1 Tax=Aristolochia fimbriata TaxID=158543 RepID=A0AAV7F7P6_ARIFI|nr:hypothetical protein H6P81_001713 [Aristolochia fimbriata]